MAYAVVRVRSSRKIKKEVQDTLDMLRLNRVNHCTVVPETPQYEGMLQKVKDMVTWGEIDIDTLVDILEKRSGMDEKQLDDKIEEETQYDRIDEFAIAVTSDKITLDELDGFENVFRMHPPHGGYESVKKPFNTGGSLGYRGERINSLLQKMLPLENNQEG